MDAYIYLADLHCEACGEKIRAELDAQGKRPPDLKNESTWDSDDYPKGPYPDGGYESDIPQHCATCGVFLENPLTGDGEAYVRNAITDYKTAGRGIKHVLQEWASFYDIPWGDT